MFCRLLNYRQIFHRLKKKKKIFSNFEGLKFSFGVQKYNISCSANLALIMTIFSNSAYRTALLCLMIKPSYFTLNGWAKKAWEM